MARTVYRAGKGKADRRKGKSFTAENAEVAEDYSIPGFLGVLSVLGGRNVVKGGGLILQRYYSLAVATEGGDLLNIPVCLGQGHYRSIAVNCMAVGGEVPASRGMLLEVPGWAANWLGRLGSRQTEHQG